LVNGSGGWIGTIGDRIEGGKKRIVARVLDGDPTASVRTIIACKDTQPPGLPVGSNSDEDA
jgi:hypothetical protein